MNRHTPNRCKTLPLQIKHIRVVALFLILDRSFAASHWLPSLGSIISLKDQVKKSAENFLGTEIENPSLSDFPTMEGRQSMTQSSTSHPLVARLRKWNTPRVSSSSAIDVKGEDFPYTDSVTDTNSSLPSHGNDTLSGGVLITQSPPTDSSTPKERKTLSFWRSERSKFSRNETVPYRNETKVRMDTETITRKQESACVYNKTKESTVSSNNITEPVELSQSTTIIENVTTTTGPSFIVVQRSPVPSRAAPLGYYKGGLVVPASPMPLQSPPPTAESSVVLIVSALLPILSRIFLLMLLSGSSLFFGPNDLHPIYSPSPTQHFTLERINDRYSRDDIAFQRAVRHPPANKSKRLWKIILSSRRRLLQRSLESESKNKKNDHSQNHRKNGNMYTKTVLLIDVHTNDIHSTVQYLRDAVSFILHTYHSKDSRLDLGTNLEVIFNVESPGGAVQDYGLAADHIARLRKSGEERGDLTVTVCVDRIAASGGYMIACQASKGQLLAAPLAIVGSIGVLRETLNIYDMLTKYGVRPLLIKAGKAKVPLTSTNEVTKEGLAFVQKNVDTTHEVFKKMVLDQRGNVIDKKHVSDVTSGDIFLGTDALSLGLVDRLVTSDEYICEKVMQGDRVLRLQKYDKSRAGMRFSPLDLLRLYKDSLLQGNLSWIQQYTPLISSVFKIFLTASLMKVLDMAKT